MHLFDTHTYFLLYQFRFLELLSSGRKDEIRFVFSHLTTEGELLAHTESFSYRLADNTWHKIALTISGTEIQLMIDCHPLYKRVTHFIPDRNFSASNMQLYIGQSYYRNYFFKVINFRFVCIFYQTNKKNTQITIKCPGKKTCLFFLNNLYKFCCYLCQC
jgi:hypothetical protein